MNTFHIVLGVISILLMIDGSFILSNKGKAIIKSMNVPIQIERHLNLLGKILFKAGLLQLVWVLVDYLFFPTLNQGMSSVISVCLFLIVIGWEYVTRKKSN